MKIGTGYVREIIKTNRVMKIDLKPNELVVKAGDTQHLDDEKKVGGKLILTNQRIYFHSPENREFSMEIMPSEIEEVMCFNTSFFSSNGLNIITKEGKELKFKIKKRNAWSKAINQMY